jgi:DNA primase
MASVRPDVDEIKRRANIVDVVSEYVTLRKTGINYTGLCPFHKEKTPSFSVNVDKQIFYCFGCGEGGDVLAFLMKINQMTFPEALRHLAEKLGIVLSQEYGGREAREKKSLREELYRVNQLAAEYFAGNLQAETGKAARSYLGKRRMGEEVIRTFRLGYAHEGWRNLRAYFDKKKVPPRLLEKAGLLIPKGEEDFYDRFRGRLIFPIEGMNGNVIAFGGRALGDEMPKYLNSPESPVYTKGKNLYGLSRAKEEIRRKKEAILVEGYFDFLQLWNAGIRNAVATLGTALTRDHLDLLRRYTGNVVVLFDPDAGGRSAIERSLRLFVAEKMHARIVILPEGCDPDDYVMMKGKESLEDQISRAQSLVDYYIDHVIGSRRGLEDSLDAVEEAIRFIVQIEDVKARDLFIQRVSDRIRISEETLRAETRKALVKIRKTGGEARVIPAKDSEKVDPVELAFIHLLMEHPEWHQVVREEKVLDYFVSDVLKDLGRTVLEGSGPPGRVDVAALLDSIRDRAVREKLTRLMDEGIPRDGLIAKKQFEDTARKILQRWFRRKRKMLDVELAKTPQDKKREMQILLEKQRLMKEEEALTFTIRET